MTAFIEARSRMIVRTGLWLVRAGLVGVLALLGLMPLCRDAAAARYSVAQCGWGVGRDADWGENATQRYNHSALCVPSGSDPWAGVEIRTYTRPGAGSAAAATTGRWRWLAPADTRITNVRGTWWHRLYNHFQHRLGGMQPSGTFHVSHSSSTSRGMEAFAAGFGAGVLSFESRLICARVSPQRCDTSPSSSAMVRALTITLDDSLAPTVQSAGSALSDGWLRGAVEVTYTASDRGGGMRAGETTVDGARVGYTEHACDVVSVAGVLHGRKMLPCPLNASGRHAINTAALSDGQHSVRSCVTDFAGNTACGPARQIRIDNNPPTAPVALKVEGGDGWRNRPSFDLVWSNPVQGSASPIVGATYRITGPSGFDSGAKYQSGTGIAKLAGLALADAGEYRVSVHLHDQAGHSSAANSAEAIVRFDDLPPDVGFRGFSDVGMPERIRARIFDRHSGPAGGEITYRREGGTGWTPLPARLEPTGRAGEADLVAIFPSDSLEPDRYEFRVVGHDMAGNRAESSHRIDGGGKMLAEGPLKTPTVLEARVEAGAQSGNYVSTGFLAQPLVTGRLAEGNGRPLVGRQLHVVVTPDAGAAVQPSRFTVSTGPSGEFRFQLNRSTSRRVEVRFAGDDRFAASRAPDLAVRVAGAASMQVNRKRLITGTAIRFTGRVNPRDARVPPDGKLVAIQFLDRRARQWRPVLFARSNGQGRFRSRYRFRFITRPTTVRMRAVAMPEALWPYTAAVSRPVNVRVLPRSAASRRRAARVAGGKAARRAKTRKAARKRARIRQPTGR